LSNPPRPLRLVIESLCVVFGLTPSWEAFMIESHALPRLEDRLVNFDIDNNSKNIQEKLEKYMQIPELNFENVNKTCLSGSVIFQWLNSYYNYVTFCSWFKKPNVGKL
jgi:hypothetical protein